jgi:hypothetical protein
MVEPVEGSLLHPVRIGFVFGTRPLPARPHGAACAHRKHLPGILSGALRFFCEVMLVANFDFQVSNSPSALSCVTSRRIVECNRVLSMCELCRGRDFAPVLCANRNASTCVSVPLLPLTSFVSRLIDFG